MTVRGMKGETWMTGKTALGPGARTMFTGLVTGFTNSTLRVISALLTVRVTHPILQDAAPVTRHTALRSVICAGFAAGVALSAAVLALIKALWTLIHTLPGALQVQQRRCAHPAGVRPWARALLTGTVTLLAALPCAEVPSGTVADAEMREQMKVAWCTAQTVSGRRPGTGGTHMITGHTETQLYTISLLMGTVSSYGTYAHARTIVEVVGQSTGLAVRGAWAFAGLAELMTCLASELVALEERFGWAVRISSNSTHHGVGIQNQTLFTLQTLGGFWTLTACTGLVTLLAFLIRGLVICSRWALFQAHALVEFWVEGRTCLAIIRERTRAGGTGGVAAHTDALIQVFKITLWTDGLACPV